jgi:hypothetical protein
MRKLFSLVALLLVLLPAFAECTVPKNIPPASTQKEDLDKVRKFIWKSYAVGIDEVLKESENTSIAEVSKIWSEYSVVLRPAKSDAKFLRGVPIVVPQDQSGNTLKIIPILKEDTTLQGEWKNIFENIRGAKMFHGGRKDEIMIAIVFVPMTNTWRGLDGIHEVIHAIEMENNSSPASPLDIERYLAERSAMEASAYEFVATITSVIGHKRGDQKWLDLINKEAKRVQEEYARTKKYPPPPQGIYRPELEEIFGQSQSLFEDRERETVLWVSGFMQSIFGLKNDQEALQRKIEFFTSAVVRKLLK